MGRKHAQKLRILSLVLGYALPVVLLLLPFTHFSALVAVLSHLAGVAASRWLFFAEAEHVVGVAVPDVEKMSYDEGALNQTTLRCRARTANPRPAARAERFR